MKLSIALAESVCQTSAEHLNQPNAKLLTHFTELLDTKQITPLVAAVLPLAEAGRAHEMIERHPAFQQQDRLTAMRRLQVCTAGTRHG